VNIARSERGAAAVEFALVSLLLVTMIIGICEFGFIFFTQGTMAGAAREAARDYAIYGDVPQAQAAASAAAPGIAPLTVTIVACPTATATTSPYAETTATVTHPYSGLTGFFPFLPSTLTAKGVMRCGG
jgi:Flp pilus assembly protein TadG